MTQAPVATVRLGERGPKVSRLCLSGTLFSKDIGERDAHQIIARYREAGGNFIDATGTLGGERSERIVGRVLKAFPGNWIVATGSNLARKPNCGLSAPPSIWLRDAVEQSLARLGRENVDIYYLRFNEHISNLEETVETVGNLIEAGKIRGWGFTDLHAWKIAELVRVADCLDVPRPVAAQPYYHALYRHAERDYLPACAHFGIGVVTYAPLARGLLSDERIYEAWLREHEKTPPDVPVGARGSALDVVNAIAHYLRPSGREIAQFAVHWVLANRLVSSVMIRPRSLAQLDLCLGAADMPYSSDDESFVNRLVPSGNGIESAYRDAKSAAEGRIVL